jgi:hypothetical protein
MSVEHDTKEIPLSEEEVLRAIRNTLAYAESHQETLPNQFYKAIDGISRTVLAYKNAKGAPGWSKTILTDSDERVWSDTEADLLEKIAPKAFSQLISEAESQKGGANPILHVTPQSELITLPVAGSFSIDSMIDTIRKYVSELDDKNREIASILGPVAIIKEMTENYTVDPTLPNPFPKFLPDIKIPSRAILPMITSILETCRVLVSNGYYDIVYLRKILSVILAVFDVTRGEWKNGVLNFIGYFGQDYMKIGQSLIMVRWIYNFISPDIQVRLEDDLIAGGKSILIGSILWFVSIASPDYVRLMINKMLESANKSMDELNNRFEGIQQKAQASADAIGARVIFPKFPLTNFPSFDDIQNFQSILHQPEIFCSKEFQESLSIAIQVPSIRLLFELMNIPTLPEKIAETCKNQPSTVSEALVKSMTPTVLMNPVAPAVVAPTVAPAITQSTLPLTPPLTPKSGGFFTRSSLRKLYNRTKKHKKI